MSDAMISARSWHGCLRPRRGYFVVRRVGTDGAERFGFRNLELARVEPFLLLAGNSVAYRDRTATIRVASLAPVLAVLKSAGAEMIEALSQRRTAPGL